MTWHPTNANDVEIVVSQVQRDQSGSRTGTKELGSTALLSASDFSVEPSEDLQGSSGIGRANARGISRGDVDYEWSLTIEGEDAKFFSNLAADDGRANELEIIVRLQDYEGKLTGAFAGDRSLSISDGDIVEFEASGIAVDWDDKNTA